ncbi:hypothetical protein BGZ60DRAFT_437678 [Tricladium varicosporioides]|nr:hypothetical protein BGZ60DRAFT_437678 [Hymenoscyphus varicosporioides]
MEVLPGLLVLRRFQIVDTTCTLELINSDKGLLKGDRLVTLAIIYLNAFEMILVPRSNSTTSLPNGTFNYGDPNLVCTPTKWTDILLFFAANYVAHAATVKSLPGEKARDIILASLLALFYPYSGVMRGIEATVRHSILGRGNDLQKTARAGALCVVVRSREWKPDDNQHLSYSEVSISRPHRIPSGEEVPLENLESNEHTESTWEISLPPEFTEGLTHPLILKRRHIHGMQKLPIGYELAILPSNTSVEISLEHGTGEIQISSSHSVVKATVSILQVIFASVTLYRSRGRQLERYGYAAFSLTVLPYIVMSTINLLGNLLTPDFPTLYLVRSPVMNEAESRGAQFDGVIGKVRPIPQAEDAQGYRIALDDGRYLLQSVPLGGFSYSVGSRQSRKPADGTTDPHIYIHACGIYQTNGNRAWMPHIAIICSLLTVFALSAIPYVAIAALTRFRTGQSTTAERVWIMGWMTCGSLLASMTHFYPKFIAERSRLAAKYLRGTNIENKDSWFGKGCRQRFYMSLLMYSVFPIGGMVVVGKMLVENGTCIRL